QNREMAKAAPHPNLFDQTPAAPEPRRKTATPASGREPAPSPPPGYSAAHIEVLEGLEPVRKMPGMYIGGTDERALHHLFAEVLDNAMDEAVGGHAKLIEITLAADGSLTVKEDGRGRPGD